MLGREVDGLGGLWDRMGWRIGELSWWDAKWGVRMDGEDIIGGGGGKRRGHLNSF